MDSMFTSRRGGYVFLSWFGVFLWMSLIFYMSSRPGDESADMSFNLLVVFEVFFPFVEEELLHLLIRKLAHVTVYMVLFLLLANALKQHISERTYMYTYAALIGFLYAVTDEVHQVFVPGRSGNVFDVLIDIVGLGIGLLLFEFFVQVFRPQSA